MQTMMSFSEAVVTCLRKYIVFHGRGTRAEYWWFMLFSIIVLTAVNILVGFFFSLEGKEGVFGLVNLFFFLPSLSAGVRRLHDLGRSGWWILLSFVFAPLLLIYFCFPSQQRENAYGPLPCLGADRSFASFEKTKEEK